MEVREGARWLTALGTMGFVVSTWAQPGGARDGSQLKPRVHTYYAECRNPNTELCSIQSPDPSLYMYTVLTPEIPFDDIGSHWVVDLRKFHSSNNTVKVLRVASSLGDVHAIHLKLIYGQPALDRNARKLASTSIPVQPLASPQSSLVKKETVVVNNTSDSTLAETVSGGKVTDSVTSIAPVRSTQTGPIVSASLALSAKTERAALEQPVTDRIANKAAAARTSEAIPTIQPTCLDSICLGASIQTLNAPFEPVMTLGEQLRSGLTESSQLPLNAEDSFKRMEALYRKGDKDGLEKEVATWSSPGYEREQLRRNIFHLVQAYELAEHALGGKRNADTADLAMYFVPQPDNRKNGLQQTVNIKAAPLSFARGSKLHFDQGLPKVIAKTKPVFCGVFRFEGSFKSKSGYSTTVAVQTDSDGEFKVSTIKRLFTNDSYDSLQELHKDLAQRYASPLSVDIAKLILDMTKVQLLLTHPIMNPQAGAGRDEASKLFKALWQQGWMEFKGKNVGWPRAIDTIADNNKRSIAACKPKALSLD